MAAATSIAMAGVGLLGSGYQALKGAKDARDAKDALDNYKRQEFQNIAEGMQVSTLGADLQREEQARLAATQVGALQGAGVRGIVGGLGRVEAGNQMSERQIAADLDMQQRQIDQMYAQDQANIRSMQEQREQQDISGLSSQYNAGNQMMFQGIGGMAQTGIAGLSALGESNKDIDPLTGKEKAGKSTSSGLADALMNNSIGGSAVSNAKKTLFNPSNIGKFFPNQNVPMTRNSGSGIGGMNLQFDENGQLIF